MIKLTFPTDFWWGSAWSAEQAEGHGDIAKAPTNWDRWYEEEPNRFFRNIGPGTTTRHVERYVEDVEWMKKVGHNSFRVSISWARMFPDGGRGEVNEEAIKFYRDLFKRMNDEGIKVFANLYHFDMPVALQDEGGWESLQVVNDYVTYADACFTHFGDLVTNWFTFNEPLGPILGSYLEGFHYPNIFDFKRGVQAAFYTILAHAKAIEAFKKHKLDSKIGVILNLSPVIPRSNSLADKQAAEIADAFYVRGFLDGMAKGSFPPKLVETLQKHDCLPKTTPEELQTIHDNTAQLLGLNYYEPMRVQAPKKAPNTAIEFTPDWYFDLYEMPGKKMNPYRGWEIYERGIYELCMDIKENYGNIESYISENGMGVADEHRFLGKDGMIHDDYRIDYIKGHLAYLWKAINEGANIKGYHLWTFIDCWSWINSYKNPYGLIALNYETGERTMKKSGHFYKKMADENGFDYDISQLV